MWLRGPMPTIGFHCSHEQIAPGRLLRDVQHAEQAGFTAAMSSDHLSPWSRAAGRVGLRVVLPRARRWPRPACRSASSPPPASATTPPSPRRRSRPWRACSPAASGRRWAPARPATSGSPARSGRARTSATRACSSASTSSVASSPARRSTTTASSPSTVARLWTLPDAVPPLIGPAVTPATAARHAAWADGLVTVNQPLDTLRRCSTPTATPVAAAPPGSRCTSAGRRPTTRRSPSPTTSGAATCTARRSAGTPRPSRRST